MKKIHTAVVVTMMASLMISGVQPVLAAGEPKGGQPPVIEAGKKPVPAGLLSEKQAIDAVKKMLVGQVKELPELQGELMNDFEDPTRSMWFITSTAKWGATHNESSLFATVDAKTGKVTEYRFFNGDWASDQTLDREKAVSAATAFLKKYRPEVVNQLQLGNSSGNGGGGMGPQRADGTFVQWVTYDLTYNQLVNGVPFDANYISVSVDAFGHVISFRDKITHDTSNMPPVSMVLPLSKAKRLVAEQTKMELQYLTNSMKRTDEGYEMVSRSVLGYRPNDYVTINAITGRPLENIYDTSYRLANEPLKLSGTNEPWIAKSRDHAKQMVADLLKMDLSKLQYSEFKIRHEKPRGDVWQLLWSTHSEDRENTDQPIFIMANFDAKTGRLLELNRQGGERADEQKVTLTISEARDQAVEILKKQLAKGEHDLFLMREWDGTKRESYPTWLDPEQQEEFDQWTEPSNTYRFGFAVGYQGVPLSDQSYMVEIDAVTGEMISWGMTYPPIDMTQLPDNKNTISADVAKGKFLEKYPLKLAYLLPDYMGIQATSVQLVYQFDLENQHLDYVDAFTGETVVE